MLASALLAPLALALAAVGPSSPSLLALAAATPTAGATLYQCSSLTARPSARLGVTTALPKSQL